MHSFSYNTLLFFCRFHYNRFAGLYNCSLFSLSNIVHSNVYLKVTIIYGDNILRIGGIAHFARIKFCAYAACASGVALLFHAHARASMVRAQENRIVYTRCAYLRTSAL